MRKPSAHVAQGPPDGGATAGPSSRSAETGARFEVDASAGADAATEAVLAAALRSPGAPLSRWRLQAETSESDARANAENDRRRRDEDIRGQAG